MNDPLLVRLFEGLGDLASDGKAFIYGKTSSGQPIGQGRPLDQLHDQGRAATAGLQTVDLGDVGVVEARQELGFSLEAGKPFGVLGEPFGQDLQRDLTP